jgi:IS30 family transposase
MGKSYNQLSLDERIQLQVRLREGASLCAIGRELGRSASTLSRELRRQASGNSPATYSAETAHRRARRMGRKPRRAHRLEHGSEPFEEFLDLFRVGCSPQQACRTLKRMHPDTPSLHFSHETVYQAIYAMPRGDLRAEVLTLLRFGRSKRRPRSRGKDRREQIPNLVSIHDRPAEIEERIIPGHWEGDTIKGKYNRSSVGTLVERTTLFVTLAKMNGNTADAAVEGFSRVLKRIGSQLRLSMTYDRGREMVRHEQITEGTGVKVYFADPHSPWQRGINENTNGLLRQFLPKSEDLSTYSQDELDQIAWLMNTRPRKSLGWKCPAEMVFADFDAPAYWRQFSRFKPEKDKDLSS